jgi:hypothetical protein
MVCVVDHVGVHQDVVPEQDIWVIKVEFDASHCGCTVDDIIWAHQFVERPDALFFTKVEVFSGGTAKLKVFVFVVFSKEVTNGMTDHAECSCDENYCHTASLGYVIMNFSIILASRERVHLLDSLLHSIVNTVGDKSNCEVICVIDTDDRVTKRFLDRFKTSCSFVRFVVRDRAPNLNDDYLNWAWRNFSTGRNIIIVNDDVVFKTANWDSIILAHLDKYLADKPDGIAYGWIEDGLKSRAGGLRYCCFPLITRKAAETVGFVMPPEFPGWGADIGLFRIYSAVNRICELPGVAVDHVSYHNGSRNRDHISHAVEKKSIGTINPITEFNPAPYVDKLLRSMNDDCLSKSVTITGATITGATLTDVTIVGGKIVGCRIEGGHIEGGRIEGGVVKAGIVNGDFQGGNISGPGDVVMSE